MDEKPSKHKVLIVTLYGEFNFGNRLQNYALNKVIQEMGFNTDNLVVNGITQKTCKRTVKILIEQLFVIAGIKKYRGRLAQDRRIVKFQEFREKYSGNILYCPIAELKKNNWSDYDAVVSGSDQVWHNWKSFENELSYYYLSFVESNKRVSYAPSFGFSRFPENDIEQHRKGIKGIRALSCREQEGVRLIRDLTGCEATKVLDPTLLLTKEQWCEIEKKPDFVIQGDYIFTFFIGKITDSCRDEINRIKNKRQLVEININNPDDYRHYAVSPNEFVWLIHHAEIVFTDSFHCTVFSIIFHRDLCVFKRAGKHTDMFGRLQGLLEMFGLMNLICEQKSDLTEFSTDIKPESKERFETEKETSLRYLEKALKYYEK